MTNPLTISDDIQLFFRQDGSAWYSCPSGKLPEEIKEIVYRWQGDNLSHPQLDLSEQWLQAYEASDRRRDEILNELRRAYHEFHQYTLRKLLDAGVSRHIADDRVRKWSRWSSRSMTRKLYPTLKLRNDLTKLNQVA